MLYVTLLLMHCILSITMKLTAALVCDLCHHQQPSFYCSSDSAFLCSDCDSQVHTANFLVARHIRIPLCSVCKSYHSHSSKSCDHHHHTDDSSSSSSSSSSSTTCISSTTKSTTTTTTSKKTTTTSSFGVSSSTPQDWKTRDLLVDWCARLLGVSSNMSSVIEVSKHAFQVWWMDRSTTQSIEWPYRVGLAASLWLGLLRLYAKDNNNTKKILKNLQEISGVPAKSILGAYSRLAGDMMKRRRRVHQVEESWDEC